MARERGYFLTIVEKGSVEETEAFIRSARGPTGLGG